MKSKFASLAIVVLFALVCMTATLAVAGEAVADYPSKPINFIVNSGAGGTVDQGVRTLIPYLEKEMGVTVVPINMPGGSGGWIAWKHMLTLKPDGYTIAAGNAHTMFAYFNKVLNINETWRDFDFLCNMVTDKGIIAVRTDDPKFKDVDNLKDFVAFAKSYDDTLLAGVGAAGGDDEILLLKLCQITDLDNVIPVNNASGASENKATFFGGHVDMYVGNIGESYVHQKKGEIKILCVTDKTRSNFLPDVATAEEQGFPIFSGAARNILTTPGMDPALRAKLLGFLKKAVTNPDFVKAMANAGYEVEYMDGAEMNDFMKASEEGIADILDLLGW